jgi:8-oxo-dGTP pyrophosphatase MutT (NUDIX family)
MIQEPDGRVWIVQPTNGFGNRKYTLAGGTVEPGLTDQQNALKEVWEETGLQVEITGYAGDFDDSNYRGAGGRNGRLYIGKRVGGAPWDAKIESHIIDRRTGKPSAESSHVTLVTPEKAAKLLHRTDDLAQLAVVHPISVSMPTRGHGSQTMKNIVEAIQPKTKEFRKKQVEKFGSSAKGVGELYAVQEMRGFNKPPKVVKKDDFDKMMATGQHIEMLRGINSVSVYTGSGYKRVSAKELADEYKTGEHFPGHGCFGAGTYADSTKGHNNVAEKYAGYGSGEVVRMAIPKSAKIITVAELQRQVKDPPEKFTNYSAVGGHTPKDDWLGVQAALAGYDAIYVDGTQDRHPVYGKGFYVVLNRSIVTVQKENEKSSYKI